MKKMIALIVGALTVFSIGGNLVFAADLTMTKPPIIPEGANKQTTASSTPGTIDISTLKLPGVGSDQGQALQQNVLPAITNIVIGLTGGLALLFVIFSGIQILTAYGNEEKIGAAKKTLMWALAGLIISMLSYAIVQILVSICIIPGGPCK